jgi:hypothetical protein
MLPNVEDLVEQFKLNEESEAHPLCRYDQTYQTTLYPGTLELATRLGIKHPELTAAEKTVCWNLTTDLVVVLRTTKGLKLLAVARKPDQEFRRRTRTRNLLRLEREFWNRRGVEWLLITPAECEDAVVMTLRDTAPWGLEGAASPAERALAVTVAKMHVGESLTSILKRIASGIGSLEGAQRALWQSIWMGELPIDLRRGWRPHLPLRLVSRDEFQSFNPLASRRSAWTFP